MEDLEKEIDTEKNEKQKKKEDIELFKKRNARWKRKINQKNELQRDAADKHK